MRRLLPLTYWASWAKVRGAPRAFDVGRAAAVGFPGPDQSTCWCARAGAGDGMVEEPGEPVLGLPEPGSGTHYGDGPPVAFGMVKQQVFSSRDGLNHLRISDLRDQGLWVCGLASVRTLRDDIIYSADSCADVVNPLLLLSPCRLVMRRERRISSCRHRRQKHLPFSHPSPPDPLRPQTCPHAPVLASPFK